MTVEIRRSRAADVGGIADVCTRGYRATYRGLLPDEHIERTIRDFYGEDRIAGEIDPAPPHWLGYVVAVEPGAGVPGERVVGAAGGAVTGDATGELYVLYLDPDRRGEGIGTRLLDHVTGQLLEHGATGMWVSVTEGNELGLPFYRARGFIEAGRRPAYTEPDTEPDMQSHNGSDVPHSVRMYRPIGRSRSSMIPECND
ncbi:GNAT family N-acetyltransferase [Pseudonocardia phyllosphaerae]|uniref:GNAT family N-acetyltransferase n=1 Tax=Pseudonocardia phyllosphaerae TaxID=3390502 RepID=UPI00397C4990